MALTHNSYVTDLSEVGMLTNYTMFKILCTIGGEGDGEATLSGTRLDRAYAALNLGKDIIDSALNGIYSVPLTTTISNTSPSFLIKRWNINIAVAQLKMLHADRYQEGYDEMELILKEISRYTDSGPDGLLLPGYTKLAGAVSYKGPTLTPGAKFDTDTYFSPGVTRDS